MPSLWNRQSVQKKKKNTPRGEIGTLGDPGRLYHHDFASKRINNKRRGRITVRVTSSPAKTPGGGVLFSRGRVVTEGVGEHRTRVETGTGGGGGGGGPNRRVPCIRGGRYYTLGYIRRTGCDCYFDRTRDDGADEKYRRPAAAVYGRGTRKETTRTRAADDGSPDGR